MAKSSQPAKTTGTDRTADGGERALRVRVSKGKAAKEGPAGKKLVQSVKSAMRKSGRTGAGKNKGMRLAGRGAGVAANKSGRSQRVIVKARVVAVPKAGGKAAVMRYLGYIEKEGGAKDGGLSERFGEDGPVSEKQLDEFADKCAEDRHSFRLILSPENGNDMDLEQHTKDLMKQMEKDLGTKLEWTAAEHHDTDNSHVHIMVRGVDEKGADLVINKDYISHGIRARSGELATRELGYRADLDVYQGLQRGVQRAGWTGLDAELLREQTGSANNRLDFGRTPASDFAKAKRELKLERLGVLKNHGLAEQVAPGRWRISEEARTTLQSMSSETARAGLLNPHLIAEQTKEHTAPDKETLKLAPVRGVVLDRGMANSLTGTEYIVVGGYDGKVHYSTVGHYSERHLSHPAKVGDSIALRVATPSAAGSADRNVLKRTENGIYDPSKHLVEVNSWREGVLPNNATPEEYVDAHCKRMDALATRGHIKALPDGRYEVPKDLVQRIEADPALNRDRQGIVRVDIESRGPVKNTARVAAQSFLDGELVAGTASQLRTQQNRTRTQAQLLEALEARTDKLIELRLANRNSDGTVTLAANYQIALRERELSDANNRLAGKYGQPVNMDEARRFQGRVEKIEQLPSGPHAVIVSGDTFAVVPAKGGLEKMEGREVQVTMPKGHQLAQTNMQQSRLRYIAMDTLTPTKDLGLGLKGR
jgi:type IV secretory pathway VirD2 relaxase